jgi:hypothetical protein
MAPVRFFLARALAPHVQANSRWIGVNAAGRRAFSVAGKDSGSPFLSWLATGRADEAPDFAEAASSLGIDAAAGIGGLDYVDWYRLVNFDYPFLDYSEQEARQFDRDLMDAYAHASLPPPFSTISGQGRRLCAGAIRVSPEAALTPTEALLAAWLRIAAGFTWSSPGRWGPTPHRTSPSGGARHPTDINVSLGPAWGDLAGAWFYEPTEHALLPSDIVTAGDLPAPAATFTVSSHVERAMWRYRDVRAFRPVLYDAGHVIETLIAVIRSAGWKAAWVPEAAFSSQGTQLDPVLGHVIATAGAEVRRDDNGAFLRDAGCGYAGEESELRTNPMLSLAPQGHGLMVKNHLQSHGSLAATPPMINALAYATPSARFDRPTSPPRIAAATGIGDRELDALRSAGLLLELAQGERLWAGISAWSSHDWFLSALLHAEAIADADSPRQPQVATNPYAWSCLPSALENRRTCRALRPGPLAAPTVQRLLAAARPEAGVRLVVSSVVKLGSLSPGVYAIEGDGPEQLDRQPIADDDVARAAIGQPWARGFSCVAWIVPSPEGTGAGQWEDRMIRCGRLAQRMALSCSDDPSNGVFQTPAMVDGHLETLLSDRAGIDGAYLVGIGKALDQGPPVGNRQFSVVDLYATPAP